MITYKITCMFQPDWNNLFTALIGSVQHCASKTGVSIAEFTFPTAQTAADLGPLVKVEIIPTPK